MLFLATSYDPLKQNVTWTSALFFFLFLFSLLDAAPSVLRSTEEPRAKERLPPECGTGRYERPKQNNR